MTRHLLSRDELLRAIDSLRPSTILVIGDLMLDRYVWGSAQRVSQEAPVLVLQATSREDRLGGAANVANLLRGLGSRVTVAGVLGGDATGERVRRLLEQSEIDAAGILTDASRPTTLKERFVGRAAGRHAHQVLRVDQEVARALDDRQEAWLLGRIEQAVEAADVVVVADYGKGVCTPELLAGVMARAAERNVPVIVDPCRGGDYRRYRGASILKANRQEAESATGRTVTNTADALQAAEQLRREMELPAVVVTLDRDGMAAVLPDGTAITAPTEARLVYDISGAGDMAVAMIAASVAGGLALEAALELANIAAGLQVERFGACVVARSEIRQAIAADRGHRIESLDHLTLIARQYRAEGKTIALANGCFDLLHVGHLAYLKDASRTADVLIVAVNSDEGVRRLKGRERPIVPEVDRAAMVGALACVDHVVVFGEDTPHGVIEALRPDVLVKGGDYEPHQVVGRELVEAYGGRVTVTRRVDDMSTSRIIAAMRHGAPMESGRRAAPAAR
ncbi:MAG: PfkB family carbohydrate kinase [Pirellulaceae bacterium]